MWIGVTADGLVARTHDDKAPRPFRQRRAALPGQGLHDGYDLSSCCKAGQGRRRRSASASPKRENLSDGIAILQSLAVDRRRYARGHVLHCPPKRSDFPPKRLVSSRPRAYGMVKKTSHQRIARSLRADVSLGQESTKAIVLGWVGLTDGKKKDVLLVTSGAWRSASRKMTCARWDSSPRA